VLVGVVMGKEGGGGIRGSCWWERGGERGI